MLPKDFPPYNLVYYYFSKWKNEGVFEVLFIKLHIWLRIILGLGREECPSLGLIDSRSVKTSHHVDGCRGIDGNKKIKGRKQHLVVDTLGIPLAIVVHKANIHDSVGALQVFEDMRFILTKILPQLCDNQERLRKNISKTQELLDNPVFHQEKSAYHVELCLFLTMRKDYG